MEAREISVIHTAATSVLDSTVSIILDNLDSNRSIELFNTEYRLSVHIILPKRGELTYDWMRDAMLMAVERMHRLIEGGFHGQKDN